MSLFADGPAQGVVLSLSRAPFYLRVVRTAAGDWDALDQPSDEIKAGELATLYRLASRPTVVLVDTRDKSGRRLGFRLEQAVYVQAIAGDTAGGQPLELPTAEQLASTTEYPRWATHFDRMRWAETVWTTLPSYSQAEARAWRTCVPSPPSATTAGSAPPPGRPSPPSPSPLGHARPS